MAIAARRAKKEVSGTSHYGLRDGGGGGGGARNNKSGLLARAG